MTNIIKKESVGYESVERINSSNDSSHIFFYFLGTYERQGFQNSCARKNINNKAC